MTLPSASCASQQPGTCSLWTGKILPPHWGLPSQNAPLPLNTWLQGVLRRLLEGVGTKSHVPRKDNVKESFGSAETELTTAGWARRPPQVSVPVRFSVEAKTPPQRTIAIETGTNWWQTFMGPRIIGAA